jgi:uracil-DNA glycosylase
MNKEQEAALKAVLKGHNIFLTGQGGTGKSFLVGKIKDAFSDAGRTLAITATTGCAALLLGHGAKTIYSWASVGLAKEPASKLVSFIRRGGKGLRRWLTTDALIIDEVSMMTPELFEKLDIIGKAIRMNSKPFGGIQLILVGDFFQLPPVYTDGQETKFMFESQIWAQTVQQTIELTQIMRQSDPVFQELLTEVREGRINDQHLGILEERREIDWRREKIRPSLLFSRRMEVDYINSTNLKALKGERHAYEATTEFSPAATKSGTTVDDLEVQRAIQKLDRDAPYQPSLVLAVGAQVMLVNNMDIESGLVNGSRGVITQFGTAPTYIPHVLFKGQSVAIPIPTVTWEAEDPEGVMRRQVPLVLAYAVTIHKCQGATLDSALIDIGSSTFEYGQAYVALSRVKYLEALYIHGLDPKAIRAHPKVVAFYKELRSKMGEEPPDTGAAGLVSRPTCELSEPGDLSGVAPDWLEVIEGLKAKPVWLNLTKHIQEAREKGPVYPEHNKVFTALRVTPLSSVRVVILGQDPYPSPGHGNGLAFSVEESVRPFPCYLRNIFKEAMDDLGEEEFPWPLSGDLTRWAKQGVLLINTTLTVDAGAPKSHSKFGWIEIVDSLLREVSRRSERVVFVLWGKDAQAFKGCIQLPKHVIIEGVHPSPLSASRGFFGSKPFSKVNEAVRGAPIVWRLA